MLETIAYSIFNGVLYGTLLFMMSSGLTLIFGMMGVLNFAHASFYMLGAYFAYTFGLGTGFWVALFLAPIAVGAMGALVCRAIGLQEERAAQLHQPLAEPVPVRGLDAATDRAGSDW